MSISGATGALAGVRVVEFAAIGPVPFCGMVLADMGAEVIRVERPVASDLGIPVPARFDHLNRGKRSLALDIRHPEGFAAVRLLLAGAQVLLEGFRPGTMERLGLGPDAVLGLAPALVYGRISGWGEEGPLARAAGHDLNFVAASGALGAMGRPGEPPPVPLNLIGDFGGAAMHMACGVLAALHAAGRDGRGQVVSTSIAGATVALTPLLHGLSQAGLWSAERADNLLDGGAPFYRCYEARDGLHVAVGAIEAKFYRALVEGLGLAGEIAPEHQMDRARWPDTARRMAARFAARTRADWCAHFDGTDACVSPVLGLDEVADHPQHRANNHFARVGGAVHPGPQPALSRTPSAVRAPAPEPGADTEALLGALGYGAEAIVDLEQRGLAKRAPACPGGSRP